MKISVGSDLRQPVTDAVIQWLVGRDHDITLVGLLADGDDREWVDVSEATVRPVADGTADTAVLFCWSGTGAAMAANKVRGVRAALCGDAETARLARKFNHANVLVMSMRATSPAVALETLEAYLEEPLGEDAFDVRNVTALNRLDVTGP
ncbi:MAG: RpiB/LacA/LacB family sugar-phosphate isomerase [Actinobacteria bacterium]|jgi:ribose 5-phosphate isomerase B|nr:RpiB/LacA/LacB family sugar-phosphate isomerase [Actinomycetota bacterium]